MDIPQEKVIQIPLTWEVGDDISTKIATNLVIQFANEVFVLYFFEALPPVVVGTDEEIESKIRQMGTLKAKCVAKIVVPASLYPGFLQTMKDHFDNVTGKK